jgi:(2Fe-2S) ferredoxin
MPDKPRLPPETAAREMGVGKFSRHLLICCGPDCVDPAIGEKTWEYVKRRLKQLKLTGPDGSCFRTKCHCLRICNEGPIAVVYPEGTWYRNVTPENAERIIQEHVIDGKIVEELCFARNPL